MKKIMDWLRRLFGIAPKVESKPPVIVPPVIITPEPEKPFEQPNIEKIFPNWKDRRPLGMLMLASAPDKTEMVNLTNYRWARGEKFGVLTEKDIDNLLTTVIAHAKDCNMQGVVIWDIEGAMFHHQFTYLGEPRAVPAEVLPLIDKLFTGLKKAGLKIGLCIRPDIIKWIGGWPHHFTAPDPVQEMIDKIEYAYSRWGCTMFYIDSNIWPRDAVMINLTEAGRENEQPPTMDASAFEKLAKRFPDFLLIPEQQDLRYYEFTAPYNNKDYRHSIALEKSVHPNAFQVLDVGYDVLPPFTDAQLKESVKEGNILMGRCWFLAPELNKIKQAYES